MSAHQIVGIGIVERRTVRDHVDLPGLEHGQRSGQKRPMKSIARAWLEVVGADLVASGPANRAAT